MASAFQAMLALNVKARSLVFLMFALFQGKEQKDKKESKFKRIFMQIHYYSFSFYVFFFQPQTSNWFFFQLPIYLLVLVDWIVLRLPRPFYKPIENTR